MYWRSFLFCRRFLAPGRVAFPRWETWAFLQKYLCTGSPLFDEQHWMCDTIHSLQTSIFVSRWYFFHFLLYWLLISKIHFRSGLYFLVANFLLFMLNFGLISESLSSNFSDTLNFELMNSSVFLFFTEISCCFNSILCEALKSLFICVNLQIQIAGSVEGAFAFGEGSAQGFLSCCFFL